MRRRLMRFGKIFEKRYRDLSISGEVKQSARTGHRRERVKRKAAKYISNGSVIFLSAEDFISQCVRAIIIHSLIYQSKCTA